MEGQFTHRALSSRPRASSFLTASNRPAEILSRFARRFFSLGVSRREISLFRGASEIMSPDEFLTSAKEFHWRKPTDDYGPSAASALWASEFRPYSSERVFSSCLPLSFLCVVTFEREKSIGKVTTCRHRCIRNRGMGRLVDLQCGTPVPVGPIASRRAGQTAAARQFAGEPASLPCLSSRCGIPPCART
jgi:hypothetical protein